MEERLGELESKFTDLDKQLTILNTELPHLRESLNNAVKKIALHEDNMTERMGLYVKCRDERLRLSEGAKWLWMVITTLIIFNTGILLNILLRK